MSVKDRVAIIIREVQTDGCEVDSLKGKDLEPDLDFCSASPDQYLQAFSFYFFNFKTLFFFKDAGIVLKN